MERTINADKVIEAIKAVSINQNADLYAAGCLEAGFREIIRQMNGAPGKTEAQAMSEDIPAWAVERAIQEIGPRAEPWNIPHEEVSKGVRAFARYIAAHEQPSVDPDVLAVREILAAHHSGLRLTSEEYRTGFYDKHAQFQAALAAYRKHKEAGE